MMKLSASHVIMSVAGRPEPTPDEVFAGLARAGYERVDVSFWAMTARGGSLAGDDWETKLEAWIAAKEKYGLPVHQTHGNVLGGSEWDDPATDMAFYNESVRRGIVGTARLGASYMVLHPYNISRARLYNPKENLEANLRFFAPYIEEAKKAGVGIAIENMVDFRRRHRRYCGGNIFELIELVDTINDPDVAICFDTGHGNIDGVHAGEAIRAIGKRLVCTHINDNHSKEAGDEHLLPFFGDIDWKDAMAALREIGYDGDFAYEIGSKQVSAAAHPAWLAYTAAVGRSLLNM